MTEGWLLISAGVPSAITCPKLRTTTRSQVDITTLISCSTSRTDIFRSSASLRMRSTSSPVSTASRPAAGSSSIKTEGAAATAREAVHRAVQRLRQLELPHGRHRGRRQRVATRPEHIGQPGRSGGLVGTSVDVLSDGEVLEQLQRLEGPA